MKSRRIGSIPVSEVGLGACLLSNEGRPGDAQAIATIHAALDAGVTLIDTADAYAISTRTSATTSCSFAAHLPVMDPVPVRSWWLPKVASARRYGVGDRR